jgi:hypothetical protein
VCRPEATHGTPVSSSCGLLYTFKVTANGPWTLAVYEGANGGAPNPTPAAPSVPARGAGILYSFSGGGSESQGPSFNAGQKWQATWVCTAFVPGDTIQVTVYQGGQAVESSVDTCDGQPHTSTHHYGGYAPGQTVLTVLTHSAWTIVIQPYPSS